MLDMHKKLVKCICFSDYRPFSCKNRPNNEHKLWNFHYFPFFATHFSWMFIYNAVKYHLDSKSMSKHPIVYDFDVHFAYGETYLLSGLIFKHCEHLKKFTVNALTGYKHEVH